MKVEWAVGAPVVEGVDRQGDRMSQWKKSPKMQPNPFLSNFIHSFHVEERGPNIKATCVIFKNLPKVAQLGKNVRPIWSPWQTGCHFKRRCFKVKLSNFSIGASFSLNGRGKRCQGFNGYSTIELKGRREYRENWAGTRITGLPDFFGTTYQNSKKYTK
jgi:hypothetical protein